MGWDSSRPVPWQKLAREWLIYIAIMAAVLAVFFRDSGLVGALAGLLVSGPLYLFFGFVMAKFGYQRTSLADMRTKRAERTTARDDNSDEADGTGDSTSRRPPAPTRRTSGGGNRPRSKPRRR